jgi:hypothetical protein
MRPSAVPWGRRLARMKHSLAGARMYGPGAATPGPARFPFRAPPANATSIVIAPGGLPGRDAASPEPGVVHSPWFRRAAAPSADVSSLSVAVMTGHVSASPGQGVAPALARRLLDFVFGRNSPSLPEGRDHTAVQSTPAELDFEIGVHEAGHALASRLLNDCVSLVSIVEDEKLGRAGVTISGNGAWADLAMARSASDNYARIDKMANIVDRNRPRAGESRDVAESWVAAAHSAVVKLMAGVAGEVLIFGKANDRRAAGDYAEALRLSLTIATNASAAQAFIEFAGIEAVELLRPYSAVVRALAEELVARRELNGGEVDEVIAAALARADSDRETVRRAAWRDLTRRAQAFEKDRPQ